MIEALSLEEARVRSQAYLPSLGRPRPVIMAQDQTTGFVMIYRPENKSLAEAVILSNLSTRLPISPLAPHRLPLALWILQQLAVGAITVPEAVEAMETPDAA